MTATKQRPDKDEIGRALERALGYAGKAADFGRSREDRYSRAERRRLARRKLAKLLPLVGLAV